LDDWSGGGSWGHEPRRRNDRFFELNFYESNNKNDGWVKVLFKVFVRARPVANPTCVSCHTQGI
jgi:hypothetical protein